MKITVGADPEVFAFRGDVPVSVHDLIPGTKFEPCKVPRGAIQVDGVAAEFNILPATSKREFLKNISHVHRLLEKFVQSKDSSLTLKAVPTAMFNQDYFNNLPADAKALGCEPDYNAYTSQPNKKPETSEPFRTGAGHIHIGWETCNDKDEEYGDTVRRIVKNLDFTLEKQSHVWDDDKTRQKLYGQKGAFRYKPYGVEYRVLSNRWLASRYLQAFVFDAAVTTTRYSLANKKTLFEEMAVSTLPYSKFMQYRGFPIVNDYFTKGVNYGD